MGGWGWGWGEMTGPGQFPLTQVSVTKGAGDMDLREGLLLVVPGCWRPNLGVLAQRQCSDSDRGLDLSLGLREFWKKKDENIWVIWGKGGAAERRPV